MGGLGQNFHFDLFERAPLGRKKAFYRMSKLIFVQKLFHFEVRNFGRISYKTSKFDVDPRSFVSYQAY